MRIAWINQINNNSVIMETDAIIPCKSIAEYQIGWTYEQLTEYLPYNYKVEELELGKKISCDNFSFWINNITGTIDQISAKSNFSGKFEGKIGLGSTLKDIEQFFGKWEEDLDVYIIPQYKGLCFEIKDVEDFDEEWIEDQMPINVISVYDPDETEKDENEFPE